MRREWIEFMAPQRHSNTRVKPMTWGIPVQLAGKEAQTKWGFVAGKHHVSYATAV